MTDQEIIQGLIARDNYVTEEFFFVKCRPLFLSIIRRVFSYEVDYDEFVSELYQYLMENDAARLRTFAGRSSLYQWIKVLAVRYFIKRRDNLIEDASQEPLSNQDGEPGNDDMGETYRAHSDLQRLFHKMPNQRYAFVIRKLMVEDMEPEQLAAEMHITTANLYNLKRRAMVQLTRTALKDIEYYGK